MIYSIEGKKIKVGLAKSLTMGDNNYYAGIFTEDLEPINKTFRAFSTRETAERWVNMRFLRKLFGSSIVLLITASLISPSSSLAQDFWWTSDYPTFVNVVKDAPEKILSTSYKTGPDGRAEVYLCVKKDEKVGLILEAKLPKQTLFSIDPKTGKKKQAKNRPTLTIRDHDLDGMPDSFNMVPSGQPLYEESLTQDGYIKYRHSQDHRVIFIQWVVGIGYSINHFMYGIDSAMPR